MKTRILWVILIIISPISIKSAALFSAPKTFPISIADQNVFFSPWNVYVKEGSYAQLVNTGAYCKFSFQGTGVSILSDITYKAPGETCVLRILIDNGADHLCTLTGKVPIKFEGLSPGDHTVEITLQRDNNDRHRGDGLAGCRITGFTVTGGGTIPQVLGKKKILWYGDSLSEFGLPSFQYDTNQFDNMTTYSQIAASVLGEYGNVGFSGQAWLNEDSVRRGTPTFPNSWAYYWNCSQSLSRLSNGLLSPQPDVIVINEGTNDEPSPDVTSVVTQTLGAIRAAAPKARIEVIIPFTRTKAAEITRGFTNWGDSNSHLVDLGEEGSRGLGWGARPFSYYSSDGVHNYSINNARLACVIVRELEIDFKNSIDR